MSTKVLLISSERRWQRPLYRVLRSAHCEIDFIHAADELPTRMRQRDYALLLVDYDTLPDAVNAHLRTVARDFPALHVLVLSEKRARTDLQGLFQEDFLSNFIAKNTAISSNEVVITVSKILRNDIFGMEKYLSWGVEPEVQLIRHSHEKERFLDATEHFVLDLGIGRRFATLAKTVADEFLMNAIYNAPVDAAGQPLYRDLARTEPISLNPAERVILKVACDGHLLAISVRDNFGSLDLGTIKSYLTRCFAREEESPHRGSGGAGLGLFYVYESLNHLIINIDPQRSTEVIGIIDVAGSYRDFAERPKSFNVFVRRHVG